MSFGRMVINVTSIIPSHGSLFIYKAYFQAWHSILTQPHGFCVYLGDACVSLMCFDSGCSRKNAFASDPCIQKTEEVLFMWGSGNCVKVTNLEQAKRLGTYSSLAISSSHSQVFTTSQNYYSRYTSDHEKAKRKRSSSQFECVGGFGGDLQLNLKETNTKKPWEFAI